MSMPTFVDLVVKNGRLRTMDLTQPTAEALAVSSGRIIAVGDSKELAGLVHEARQVVDLHGRTVLPGFIDTHAHLADIGVRLLHLDLGNAKSVEEALAMVQGQVTKTRPGELIIGYNWDESGWTTPRYLTKRDLDQVAPRHPVVLIRVCGHLAAVNTLALQRLAVDPTHRGVDKDARTGELTGVLRDIPIDPRSLEPVEGQASQALVAACRYANSLGLTSAHENLYQRQLPFVREYLQLRRAGELSVRVYCNLEAKLLDQLAGLGLSSGLGDEDFRLGGLKAFADGSFGAQTAALSHPYHDRPDTDGLLMTSDEDYRFLLETANRLGQQVNTHAIGDRAIDFVLRCHQKVGGKEQVKRQRHTLIHAEFLTAPLLKRVKQLGMILLMQPNFVHRWGLPGGMYDQRLGAERAQLLNNFRSVLDAGVRLAFGSDCMPMEPLYGIFSAVTHPNPATRITVEEALRCYTVEAAYASFEEADKGSLAVGKLADFVILSHDPLAIDPADLGKVVVEQTYVGGRCVYSRL
jgi:predicted amidohydrolase YtcJ